MAADCMPRTKTVPLTPLSLRPGSQGTGLGMGLNCQPFQPAGCLHVLRDDFPKVDSLALGQNPRMDVTGTQGALSNLALEQESMSKFVCTDTCVYLGAKVASSAGSWKILGTQKVQRPYASVPRAEQSSAQQTSGLPGSIVYPSGPAAENSASWMSPKELRLRGQGAAPFSGRLLHQLPSPPTRRGARVRDVTEAATSQAPAPPSTPPHPRVSTAPDSLPPKSALEAEGQQPPARSRLQYRVSVSMGVTGGSGRRSAGQGRGRAGKVKVR